MLLLLSMFACAVLVGCLDGMICGKLLHLWAVVLVLNVSVDFLPDRWGLRQLNFAGDN